MEPNDELCLCFHVTRRKLVNFLRVEQPKRASQLSECFGAGTGCGWCRPFLNQMFEDACSADGVTSDLPTPEDYARMRARYIRDGHGTPPRRGP